MGNCSATTDRGEPCENEALADGGYCGFHDPDMRAWEIEEVRRYQAERKRLERVQKLDMRRSKRGRR